MPEGPAVVDLPLSPTPAAAAAASSEPQAAKPILANHLLSLEVRQRTRFTRDGRPERLSTGCGEIDEMLVGGSGGGGRGLERGIVLGLSSEGVDGRLISLNLLASVLVSHLPIKETSRSRTIATIIDTTGSFPLTLLAQVLRSRILKARALDPQSPNVSDSEISNAVQQCLEMVAISRVFDMEGLWEVMGEVRSSSTVDSEDPRSQEEDQMRSSAQVEVEIANSDDEESPITPEQREPSGESTEDEGVEMIIVDNMTQIINELFSRKEKSEAHALLTLLARTLISLTRTSNILTILHNTVIPSRLSTSHDAHSHQTTSTNPPNPYDQASNRHSRSAHHPSSLFPSNPIKPALGQIFTQFPSLHLFLSSLPKTAHDAELLYGGDRTTGDHPHDSHALPAQAIDYCTVIEILKDETPNLSPSTRHLPFAAREGTWCAVSSTESGLGFKATFEEKGSRRGLAMERVTKVLGDREVDGGLNGVGEEGVAGAERLTGRGVSNVAKIYGFGGRRV